MHIWNYNSRRIACFAFLFTNIIAPLDGQCVLPLANGTWITSSRGTWVVNDARTSISNFRAPGLDANPAQNLDCVSTESNNKYILRANISLFTITISKYTCWEIPITETSKYIIYIVTDLDGTNEPFTTDLTSACNATSYTVPEKTLVVLTEAAVIADVKITLPDVIRGNYRVTVTDQNGNSGNDTLINGCDDVTTIALTEIANSTQTIANAGFSANGELLPLYTSIVAETTFIFTYNNDTTVNDVTTYRFACWAISTGSNLVYATVYPEICHSNQNSTYVQSGGQLLVLDPLVTCPSTSSKDTTSESGNNNVIIIVAVVVTLTVVILTIIVIVIICVVRKRKQLKEKSKHPTESPEDAHKTNAAKLGKPRPKSSNDVSKLKMAKDTFKSKVNKPKTRTVAVQASIWMGPINQVKRTTTGLNTGPKRTSSQAPDKFIPYVGYVHRPLERSNTEAHPPKPAVRSNTAIVKEGPPAKQRKTTAKEKVEQSPRVKLASQISAMDMKLFDHFSSEFEKKYPFPREGNPHNYTVNKSEAIDKPEKQSNQYLEQRQKQDETSVDTRHRSKKDAVATNGLLVQPGSKTVQTYAVLTGADKSAPGREKSGLMNREPTKSTLKSRPSTTDGVLGITREKTEPARKTNSATMDRSKTILSFSYNSPYGLSINQKEYISRKRVWIRDNVLHGKQTKQQLEEMRKQENERAFEEWMKNKKKRQAKLMTKFSKPRRTLNQSISSKRTSMKSSQVTSQGTNNTITNEQLNSETRT